ncbi:prc-barrel domain protein, putative [Heliomicrobium modesticaldum Ice1]|uniref:Prc-barrel domain protein, putative n=1 Tax=Heliobacterium modesticaldum (strain ATCC 51547 / Ice1) TaxID=498761 RepID=B0TBA2_HELMI|nr:PRC-barrel domain-containing protein [Heliomicrobium modesticaldum]ABZ83829.1 prc-barrel domain protein, putative [Heliomicrobium modesticaldum Ice1]
MLASKSLLTRPIVSLDEGQKLGTVRGLVVDPEALEVVALQVDQKGLFREQKIIPYTKVHSIGDDAIVIDRSSQVQRATNLPHLFELIKSKTVIIGSKVLTTLGQKIGVVVEYYFDHRTGKLLTIEIRGHFGEGWFNSRALLPATAIRTISPAMVLVYEDALDQLTPVESAFEGTVKKVSEQTERFWTSTVSLSKEWGSAIGRAIGLDARKKGPGDDDDLNPWKAPEYAGGSSSPPAAPAASSAPATSTTATALTTTAQAEQASKKVASPPPDGPAQWATADFSPMAGPLPAVSSAALEAPATIVLQPTPEATTAALPTPAAVAIVEAPPSLTSPAHDLSCDSPAAREAAATSDCAMPPALTPEAGPASSSPAEGETK